jgi:hypothetical protein
MMLTTEMLTFREDVRRRDENREQAYKQYKCENDHERVWPPQHKAHYPHVLALRLPTLAIEYIIGKSSFLELP